MVDNLIGNSSYTEDPKKAVEDRNVW